MKRLIQFALLAVVIGLVMGLVAAQQALPPPLFEETFDGDAAAPELVFSGGEISVASGVLSFTAESPQIMVVVTEDAPAWGDYAFEVRVRSEGSLWLQARAGADFCTGYYLIMDRDVGVFRLASANAECEFTVLARSEVDLPSDWVTLRLETDGNRVAGFADGVLLFEAENTLYQTGYPVLSMLPFGGRFTGEMDSVRVLTLDDDVLATHAAFTPTFTPSATFTPSPTPTNTATATFTMTPTFTPTFTPSDTATFTPTATATWTMTPTSTDTATWTPSPVDTATFTPTLTPSPTYTATATHTPSPTDTATPTNTPAPTDTATAMPTPFLDRGPDTLESFDAPPQQAVDELVAVGLIPDAGRLHVQRDFVGFSRTGDWFEPLRGPSPVSNVVLAAELTFYAEPGEARLCTLSLRMDNGESGVATAYVDVGLDSRGNVFVMDIPEAGQPHSAVELEPLGLDSGQPANFMVIAYDNLLTVYVDGQLVFDRIVISDRVGILGVSMSSTSMSPRCEARDIWAVTFSD